ncbi:MAG: class I SAM-dependent methyltransferase [Candidatus Scalindua sp.]|jgi:hypothetical protein|nr:class I SAM-dependent methyltransferase [Candidatus Scalindua sp.]
MNNRKLIEIFLSTPKLSIKNSSYFEIYESVFNSYIGKPITFMEIGVFNGGSLHMWKEYFGDAARIIGVDLNPIALELEKDGFEVYIGDQESKDFWQELKRKVGNVDIILDDGGHKNGQQIATLFNGVDLVKNGGIIAIEDTHTSYFRRFGNPSRFSFINYSKKIVDVMNSRFQFVRPKKSKFYNYVWSINYFESIVIFNIDKSKCITSSPISNQGESIGAIDFRNYSNGSARFLLKLEEWINSFKVIRRVQRLVSKIFDLIIYIYEFFSDIKLIKYFK